jgi:hypothetical protein
VAGVSTSCGELVGMAKLTPRRRFQERRQP